MKKVADDPILFDSTANGCDVWRQICRQCDSTVHTQGNHRRVKSSSTTLGLKGAMPAVDCSKGSKGKGN